MSEVTSLANRLMALEREVANLRAQAARVPAAVAAPSQTVQVTIAGTFAVGDYLKCSAGSWSKVSATDAGKLAMGVVIAVSGAVATVAVFGPRYAAGTAGAIYYVGSTAGIGTTTAPVGTTLWQRIMEIQISSGVRLVTPQAWPFRPLAVSTCDSGSAATHTLQETA